MASVVVMGPPAAGTRILLDSKSEFVIGRSGFCDIVLNKRSISREHAKVFQRDGDYYIVDLGSLNGTSVDGRPIHGETRLKDGARINLYDVPLTFYRFDNFNTPSNGSIPVAGGTFGENNDRSQQILKTKLDDLLEIIGRLGNSLDVEVILPKVLDTLFHTFPQADSGEILLVERDGRLAPRATRHCRDSDAATMLTSIPPDRRMTQEVLETSKPLIDTRGDISSESALEFSFSSTMYVPMIGPMGKPVGIIVLETEDASLQFAAEDLDLVCGVAVLGAQALAYARAHKTTVEFERTRYHLETAREIQLRMLPRECPHVPGYSFANFYQAAQMVGGDAYIYHTLPDGRIVFAVADASGKGLPASLRIAEFISEFRHRISTATSLKYAMESLNRHVCQTEEGFITFCLAVLDPARHTLSIANAGHPTPRLRHRNGAIVSVESERGSFPFGLVCDAQFHPLTIALTIGDEFVLYTDGVTEAFNSDGEAYGTERLHEALRLPAENATKRVEQLVTDLDAFRQGFKPSDDQCIVVLRWDGA